MTTPSAKNPAGFRKSLLTGKSEIQRLRICYAAEVLAGTPYFNPLEVAKQKDLRHGKGQTPPLSAVQVAISDAKSDFVCFHQSEMSI